MPPATCHAGVFQTDHNFDPAGLPQMGPGKNGFAGDAARDMVSGEPQDGYRFRTPTLRNITQTAPYGHNGAYAALEDILRHHLDPMAGLASYDRRKALSSDDLRGDDWKAIEIADVARDEIEIGRIMAFLGALPDDGAGKRGLGVPVSVPSGLPLDAVLPPL